MKLAKTSLALLAIRIVLVSSIAAKYLYQALRLAPCLDTRRRLRPSIGHARPLSQRATHRRWLPKHPSLGKAGRLSTQYQRRP